MAGSYTTAEEEEEEELLSLYGVQSGQWISPTCSDEPNTEGSGPLSLDCRTMSIEKFEDPLLNLVNLPNLIDTLKKQAAQPSKIALEFHNGGSKAWDLTYEVLHYRTLQIASTLLEFEHLTQREKIALLFPVHSYDWFLSSLYACIMIGCIPIPILVNSESDLDSLSEIAFIFSTCRIRIATTVSDVLEKVVSVSAQTEKDSIRGTHWLIVDSIDMNPTPIHLFPPIPQEGTVIQYVKGPKDDLKGSVISVNSLIIQASRFAIASKIPKDTVILCTLEPRQGFGLFLIAILSVSLGASVLIATGSSLNQSGYILSTVRDQKGIIK